MLGLTVHNFLSAATGLAMAFALVRAFARSAATTVGNFWVDVTRITLYVLLPLSIVIALVLVALGRAADACGLGRRDDARRRQADDLDRADGEPGGDQGARHQRRRLHERQFRASVREPERLDQHAADLGAAAGPRRLGDRVRPLGRRRQTGPRDPRRHGRAARRRRRRRSTPPRATAVPARDRARRRSLRRQYGRQGGSLRSGDDRAVHRPRPAAPAPAPSTRCSTR